MMENPELQVWESGCYLETVERHERHLGRERLNYSSLSEHLPALVGTEAVAVSIVPNHPGVSGPGRND